MYVRIREVGKNTIVTVSYLNLMNIVRKGIITLIKAMKYVKDEIPDVKLIIIGKKMDGYPLLKSMVERLGLGDNVIFKGYVSREEFMKIMCSATLFAMPSLQEGFPTALAEALVSDLPIIAGDAPAINEIFTNYKHAILVRPNDPKELAVKLLCY